MLGHGKLSPGDPRDELLQELQPRLQQLDVFGLPLLSRGGHEAVQPRQNRLVHERVEASQHIIASSSGDLGVELGAGAVLGDAGQGLEGELRLRRSQFRDVQEVVHKGRPALWKVSLDEIGHQRGHFLLDVRRFRHHRPGIHEQLADLLPQSEPIGVRHGLPPLAQNSLDHVQTKITQNVILRRGQQVYGVVQSVVAVLEGLQERLRRMPLLWRRLGPGRGSKSQHHLLKDHFFHGVRASDASGQSTTGAIRGAPRGPLGTTLALLLP
mmetsp:Transcript_13459/g.50072  ORF Transcript_13459/g.50072 Transcript_13459/m.50072 type:complete len:268 (-) Transcript_13459:88-891(-)